MLNGIIIALFCFLFHKPKKKIPKTKPDPIGFLCDIIMLYYIMWSMSFIGETLKRGGRTWSDYWSQLLVKILSYPMSAKDPPDSIIYRTSKDHASNILIILVLMADLSKAVSVPNINLRG